ncbi:MAG: DegQ family serine endoprotease [Pseudolabrys sp.]
MAFLAVGLLLSPAFVAPAQARGPEAIADVAGEVIGAVVNISAKQSVDMSGLPQLPPNSPLGELFKEFKKRQGEKRGPARRSNSLGSGFIIDPAGYVVTNNHVIADSDEVDVILTDGTTLRATIVGRDTKVDLALLKVKTAHPLKAVKFGNSDKLRLGEWVVAIGNPFGFGGTVTAGIVSARNRDLHSGPYDNYIQTDAAINRGNSGGPLFNLEGQVIGVNTAIISPTGGSIGIGFALPSNTVRPVIEQLRKYGEVRRGWLGVKIQTVTRELADSLNVSPPRGALVAGVDDKGPAKPAGIQIGDVIVKFDGQDVKQMRDLPRIVADTPVGKEVEVVVLRKGREVTKQVTLGQLKETKEAALAPNKDNPSEEQPAVKKALGLDLADLTAASRKKHNIKDGVKGVLITGVEPNSEAADQHLVPGMVISALQLEPVDTAADLEKRIVKLRKGGKKSVALLVVTPDGDTTVVALKLN